MKVLSILFASAVACQASTPKDIITSSITAVDRLLQHAGRSYGRYLEETEDPGGNGIESQEEDSMADSDNILGPVDNQEMVKKLAAAGITSPFAKYTEAEIRGKAKDYAGANPDAVYCLVGAGMDLTGGGVAMMEKISGVIGEEEKMPTKAVIVPTMSVPCGSEADASSFVVAAIGEMGGEEDEGASGGNDPKVSACKPGEACKCAAVEVKIGMFMKMDLMGLIIGMVGGMMEDGSGVEITEESVKEMMTSQMPAEEVEPVMEFLAMMKDPGFDINMAMHAFACVSASTTDSDLDLGIPDPMADMKPEEAAQMQEMGMEMRVDVVAKASVKDAAKVSDKAAPKADEVVEIYVGSTKTSEPVGAMQTATVISVDDTTGDVVVRLETGDEITVDGSVLTTAEDIEAAPEAPQVAAPILNGGAAAPVSAPVAAPVAASVDDEGLVSGSQRTTATVLAVAPLTALLLSAAL